MTKDEALKLGIEALENIGRWLPTIGQKGLRDYEADAMKEALAQPAQEPRIDQGPDYERGFVDGMLYQTQTSIDKAVNAIAQPAQEPVAWLDLLKEARDNCKASIVEDGISAMRKEYRVDLERRLTAALTAAFITPPAAQPAQKPNRQAFLDWYNNEHWGNEDFKQGCQMAWEAALEQATQEPVNQRAHEMALRQWERWKTYVLELHERLAKYEDGAPMVLNSTAQPAQEPVGSLSVRYFRGAKSMTNIDFDYNGDLPEGDYELYTTPPQRPWVGLTDEEITKLDMDTSGTVHDFVDAVESALRSKNT